MLIKYYKNANLTFANRKRYNDISSFQPFSQENQYKVLLGDGASTSIKTNVSNICDYVTIDDTRWFVVSYIYFNGKQVQLNLQRDVIGEFGLNGIYGKIDRGFIGEVNKILKYRKELNLNQILYDRKPLIPTSNEYGKYKVDSHDNEMWGVLYLTKPSKFNDDNGKPYEDTLDIPIPGYNPVESEVDYPFLENDTVRYVDYILPSDFSDAGAKISYTIYLNVPPYNGYYRSFKTDIYWTIDNNTFALMPISIYENGINSGDASAYIDVDDVNGISDTNIFYILKNVADRFLNRLFNISDDNEKAFALPQVPTVYPNLKDYNNKVVYYNGKYLRYTTTERTVYMYGFNRTGTSNQWKDVLDFALQGAVSTFNNVSYHMSDKFRINAESRLFLREMLFNYEEITSKEAGSFVIDLTQNLIDEPYNIVVCPLYDVNIYDLNDNLLYKVEREYSFLVFNTIIQYLSGENPYLVDAQIFPYCPYLTNVTSEVGNLPFFNILATSYNTKTKVNLYPDNDVKKEYIQSEYNIVAPDQSDVFTFKYYDYKNENGNNNMEELNITIKTALKPFSIISSAVIDRDENSLIGTTYSSDLNGCQPSANGFECSISSSAFETYKRNNSNYQSIFNKNMEKLRKEQKVELTNDITQTVVNTVSASSMGAIGGASLADLGVLGSLTKSGGAIVGASVAGGTVAAAMIAQTVANSSLRDYEKKYEQEMFDLNIGTIKNIPNQITRVSSFNEIIARQFRYYVEKYSCSSFEKSLVDTFIEQYGYEIGVYDFISNYYNNGWFLKADIIKSGLIVNLHMIAVKELSGGIYYYE